TTLKNSWRVSPSPQTVAWPAGAERQNVRNSSTNGRLLRYSPPFVSVSNGLLHTAVRLRLSASSASGAPAGGAAGGGATRGDAPGGGVIGGARAHPITLLSTPRPRHMICSRAIIGRFPCISPCLYGWEGNNAARPAQHARRSAYTFSA